MDIILYGLPTHILEVEQHQEFHVANNIVSFLLLLIFAYYYVHGNLVEKITSKFSHYLFGDSKPALALLLKKISANVVHRLFVPITLAAMTVSLTGSRQLLSGKDLSMFDLSACLCDSSSQDFGTQNAIVMAASFQ